VVVFDVAIADWRLKKLEAYFKLLFSFFFKIYFHAPTSAFFVLQYIFISAGRGLNCISISTISCVGECLCGTISIYLI
jgi:hypothetical protein